MKNPTALKNILELRVGNIVHFYGARFEITTTRIIKETDKEFISLGKTEIMSANGKWLDGRIEPGYFGPTKDWQFQGNKSAIVAVEI